MKKTFFISGGVFVVALMFWGIYEIFFRVNPYSPTVAEDKQVITSPKQDTQKTPAAGIFGEAPLQAVLEAPIVGAALSVDDQYLWYVASGTSNTLYKREVLSGITETVYAFPYTPSQIRFSPDFSQALIQEAGVTGEKWHLLTLSNKQDITLKEGLRSPIWTNVGDRIVYEYDTPDKQHTINLADPDGKNWKQLTTVASADAALATLPKGSLLAAWNIPSAFQETNLQTFSLAGGTPQTIFSGRFGADYLFSPSGEKILIAQSDRKGGNRMMLGVANNSGGEYRSLDVPTLISKTAWSDDNKTVYYALPAGIPESAVLPDDYRRKPILTQDAFWKVDSVTGQKTRLVDLTDLKQTYDATKLFVDSQERYLFFTNRYDNKLYRIKLQ